MPEYTKHKIRYIDIKKITIPRGFFNQDLNVPKLFDWLYSQPEVDVVEVVRCKDCVWWYPREYGSVIGRCENPYNGLANEYIEEDDFCSYGKRKEGAEE